MKNLLYIGNNLNTAKTNVSSIQILGEKLESEGYNLKYASSYSYKLLRLIEMVWCCIRYSQWTDAVLIDTYSTQNFYFALICSQVCRIFSIPYFPILHGGDLPSRLQRSPKKSRLVFENAKTNISPSLYLKSKFEEFGYENIQFIPNAIQIENYSVKSKNYKSIRLLWVRSFSKIYNPEMAIQVLKALLDNGFKADLCMFGPDSHGSLEAVKALAKKLGVDVKFTGKLDKKEWHKLSEQYNIFVNTTNFDNMPVSVIEAIALGLPVISTNVGGIPNLIQHEKEGLLVNIRHVGYVMHHVEFNQKYWGMWGCMQYMNPENFQFLETTNN